MSWPRVESIEALLEPYTPATRRLVEATRKRIVEVVPGAVERLRGGWGLIGYNAPAYFAFIAPGRNDVRIGFEWGVLLNDTHAKLEGEGKQVRHVTPNAARARDRCDCHHSVASSGARETDDGEAPYNDAVRGSAACAVAPHEPTCC